MINRIELHDRSCYSKIHEQIINDFNIETGFDIKICNRFELRHRCPSSNCNNLSCRRPADTQNHIKKGVFMETVIIINMYICVFVSLIYALF